MLKNYAENVRENGGRTYTNGKWTNEYLSFQNEKEKERYVNKEVTKYKKRNNSPIFLVKFW